MSCHFSNRVPSYIIRCQKPRLLGMIIATLEGYPMGLSAEQVSNKLKDRGYKYYPSNKTCASLLGKYKSLFEELPKQRVVGLAGPSNGWKVKIFKLRDGWNVDREV